MTQNRIEKFHKNVPPQGLRVIDDILNAVVIQGGIAGGEDERVVLDCDSRVEFIRMEGGRDADRGISPLALVALVEVIVTDIQITHGTTFEPVYPVSFNKYGRSGATECVPEDVAMFRGSDQQSPRPVSTAEGI